MTKKIKITETAEARKEKIEADRAWEIFQDASKILVAKGKNVLQLDPRQTDKETILAAVLGRSGTLRAPTLKIGRLFLVGFNKELYEANI